MTVSELYAQIKDRFLKIPAVRAYREQAYNITAKGLSPDEILGTAERVDFPILGGKETLLTASFRGAEGQAFTSRPATREMSFREFCALPPDDMESRSLFVAGMNAVMNELGLCGCCVHCRDDGPADCGRHAAQWLYDRYGDIRVALIGYQPRLLENLSGTFTDVRVTDLGSDKIGERRFGRLVENGTDAREAVCDWAELVLCTGSTLTNGTIVDFLDLKKPLLFYGTTIAGAAALMGWERLCFADTNGK